jgi:hypothetical protein
VKLARGAATSRAQAGVALGIDLVGQPLLGLVRLVRLVALALLMEQVEDIVLGDFRRVPSLGLRPGCYVMAVV